MLTPTVAATSVAFNVIVKMPTTVNANAVWNQTFVWSQTQNQWKPVTLVGTAYPGTTVTSQGGYLTNTAATTLAVPTADAVGGNVFFVTWDYAYQNGVWAGPPCLGASGTNSASTYCWRVQSVPVPALP